ncbi:MAG: hypothetical protein HYT87_00365 [Nitrospirae bacterium]|nr:hypothetical protein [Nitrospirota bacterium]
MMDLYQTQPGHNLRQRKDGTAERKHLHDVEECIVRHSPSRRRWATAAAAAVGWIEAIVSLGGGSAWALDGAALYGQSGSAVPQRKAYTGSSSTFGATAANSANSTATNLQWVVLRDAPLRNEKMLGTLSSDGTLILQEFNGTSSTWTTRRTCTTCLSGGTNDNYRALDIAYEDSSSDALIIYENTSTTNTTVSFATWDGTTFTDNVGGLTLWAGATITRWVQLVPRPGFDTIMLIAMSNGGVVRAAEWNGTGWGSVQELTNAGITNAPGKPFGFAYEGSSGDGLAAYGTGTTLEHWTYVASTWAGPTTNSPFNGGAAVDEIQMASDPSSDTIAYIQRDAGADCNAFVWDGTAWEAGNPTEDAAMERPSTTLPSRTVDVAWGKSNATALFVYVDANGLNPEYFTYIRGSGWSVTSIATNTANTGSAWPDDVEMVQLTPNPNSDEIMLLGTSLPTGGNQLEARLWNGSSWSVPVNSPLETSPSDDNFETAMFAWSAPLPRLEQIGYKVCDNTDAVQPSTCDARDTARTGTDWEGVVRIRIGVKAIGDNLTSGTYKLQYGETSSTCASASGWTDVGSPSAVAVAWRGYGNSPADGAAITANLLTESPAATILETYEEDAAISALNATISAGAIGEWDFVVENYNAGPGQTYCFRMARTDGSTFNTYSQYPEITPTAGTAGGMVLYDDNTADGQPIRRLWSTGTQDFGGAGNLANAGNASNIQFIVAKSLQQDTDGGALQPAGRNSGEVLAGTQHLDGSLLVQRWDGTTWNNWTPGIASIVPTANADAARAFDLGYEPNTGDAMVVHENNATDQCFTYSIWDGTSWSTTDVDYTAAGSASGCGASPQVLTCGGTPASGDIRWMKLRPKSQSEEMILMFESAEGAAEALYAAHWNGSSWDNCVALVDTTSCSGAIRECFDFAWERLSGGPNSGGVMVYDNGTDIAWREFVFSTGWGGETAAAPCNNTVGGGTVQRVQMAADPTSNDLAVAVMYGAAPSDLCVDIWNGTAWQGNGPSPEVGIESGVALGSRPFDVAWELSTGKAVFVYTEANSPNVEYFTYDRPTDTFSVSSIDSNTTLAANSWPDDVYHLSLHPSPNGSQILLLGIGPESGLAAPGDIRMVLWNGGTWAEPATTLVETSPSDFDSQAAAFVWTRKDPTLVKLISFRAIGLADRVALEWDTAAERSNAGFNLYRSESQDAGRRTQVNAKMIRGLGTSARGKKYVVVDSDLSICVGAGLQTRPEGASKDAPLRKEACTLSYWLENVEFTGRRTLHGPVIAHVGLDTDGDGMTDDWERAWCTRDPVNREPVNQNDLPDHGITGSRDHDPKCLDPNVADGDGDADADGLSNLVEYLNGTMPNAVEAGVWLTDPGRLRDRGRVPPPDPRLSTGFPPPGWRVLKEDATGVDLELFTPSSSAWKKKSAILVVPSQGQFSIHSEPPAGAERGDRPSDREAPAITWKTGDGWVYREEHLARITGDPFYDGKFHDRLQARIDFPSGLPARRRMRPAPPGLGGAPSDSSGLVNRLLDWVALNGSRFASNHRGVRRAFPSTIPGHGIKVAAAETGVVRLGFETILEGGLDPSAFNPALWRAFSPGRSTSFGVRLREVPLQVAGEADGRFDKDDTILLPASPRPRKYSPYETYWLTPSSEPGLRTDLSEELQAPAEPRMKTIRVERNEIYFAEVPGPNDMERWYFAPILRDGDTKDVEVHLGEIDRGMGEARLRIRFAGLIDLGPRLDHRVGFSANGDSLGEAAWGGAGIHTINLTFASSLLHPGINTVTLAPLLPEGMPFDQLLLDSLELTYLETGAPSLTLVEPASVDVPAPTELSDPRNRADYIMILPAASCGEQGEPCDDFSAALEPLRSHHEGRGLAVKVVTLDRIYDEFGAGLETPYAVKSFLRYALTAWEAPRPTYVLLVGDASYDPKGFVESPDSPRPAGRIPTYFFYSNEGGAIPSDGWFVSFDGPRGPNETEATGTTMDLFPDMAIGRLPARTPDELRAMVDKILHYADDSPEADWRRNVLLVADNIQPEFEGISEDVFALAPSSLFLTRAYLALFPSAAGLSGALESELNEGASVVNYVGHGSVQAWAAEKLLGTSSLSRIENSGRYPFITALTCINGYFVFPPEAEFESMAEEFVRAPGKGAVAFFAPTGQSAPPVQAAVSQALYKAILQDRINPIGAAIQKAFLEVAAAYPAGPLQFVPQMFVLFGDPAMDLLIPASEPSPSMRDPQGGCACATIGRPTPDATSRLATSLGGLVAVYLICRVRRRRTSKPRNGKKSAANRDSSRS